MIIYNYSLSKIIVLILIFFSKECEDDEILKSFDSCISIEKLLREPSETLTFNEINYLSSKTKSINQSGYEIDFIRLGNKDLQSKDILKSKIYISKKCIKLIETKYDIGTSQGLVMIVSNYNNRNKNGLPERFFVIRFSGSGTNKYISSINYDFSICYESPILLNMSIPIDEIKAFKKKEKQNAYEKDTYELVDINIQKILYTKKYDIDLFDINSEFFENICFKFTSEKNSDVTLETRVTEYYQNVTLCNKKLNSFYKSSNYSSNDKTLYYTCIYGFYKSYKDKKSYLDKLDSKMNIVFSNSNFKVVSCYKEAFKYKNLPNNYGEIICLFIIFMQLILFMSFCSQGVTPLKNKIDHLLKNPPKTSPVMKYLQEQKKINEEKKIEYNSKLIKDNINNDMNNNIYCNNNQINNNSYNSNNTLNYNNDKNNIHSNVNALDINNNNLNMNRKYNDDNQNVNNDYDKFSIINEDLVSSFDKQSNNEILPNKNQNIRPKNFFAQPPKKKTKRKSVNLEKNNIGIMINNNENNIPENNINKKNQRKSVILPSHRQGLILQNIENNGLDDDKKTNLPHKNLNEEVIKAQEEMEINKKEAEKEAKEEKEEEIKRQKIIRRRSSQIFRFEDDELNELSFDEAKMFDTRTFCQYYGFMIKISNIIINTFRCEDFNLLSIKLGLLLLLFPINLTFNALFFTSKDMKSVYINKLSDISIDWKSFGRSFASSIISSIFLIFLKLLALTHHSIRKVKNEESIEKAKEKSESILKCVKWRISFYFIFSLIFLFMFGFYVTCFCTIFENTQLLLIESMLFSWFLSLLYPFAICILTSIFRICSLHGGKNKRGISCCFKINKILQMI